MFDIKTGEICDDIVDIRDASNEPVDSIRGLILEFWSQQVFTVNMVCCDLVAARAHSTNC